MGDSEVEEYKNILLPSDAKSISFTECFNKYCPIFMSYGMTYKEFWYDDIGITKFYLQAHRLKLKERDMELWEQGMYIYEAILDCAPILHPFSKAKKPLPYSEKPYTIQNDEKHKQQTSEQEIENERLKAQLWMNSWVRSMNRQHKD